MTEPTQSASEHGTDEQDTEEESLRAKVQRLESLVEHQQQTIEELEARQETDSADASERAEQETPAEDETTTDEGLVTPATRRGVLTATGALGLLGLGAGSASASSGQIGTSSSPLNKLYTDELNGGVTGGTSLTDLAGSGLTIDDSGNLNASGGGSTSELVTSGNSLTAAQVFDGGTTVSESDDSSDAPLIINGHPSNNTGGVDPFGATIAGGGGDSANSNDNEASADFATVGGGKANSAIYTYSTVGGGRSNTTNESYATIPGGRSNTADGEYSFAAGRKANTNSNDGAFVWGDSSSTSVTAGAADEVRFQAKGGFVIENGNVDAQGGTVENSTGDLTLKTNGTQVQKLLAGSSNISASSDTSTPPNIINGHPSNNTGGSDVEGVTIAGGGGDSADPDDNTASADHATVSGGKNNTASGTEATVGGGGGNTASDTNATVAGGAGNEAKGGNYCTVGGGQGNIANGSSCTIPGGYKNYASGGSFAQGEFAVADGYDSVVFNDGTEFTDDNGDDHPNPAAPDSSGFSSSTTIKGESVTGRDTFHASAKNGFRFVTKTDNDENVVTLADDGSYAELTFHSGLPDESGTQIGIDSNGKLVKSPSSARYKTNIQPLTADTSKVLDLEPKSFEYEDSGQHDTGLIAEEVDEVLPELVHYDQDGRPESVQYDRVGVYLIPEVEEHRERLADAEADATENEEGIADLEADLNAQDARIEDQQDHIERLEANIQNKDVALDALRETLDDKDERITDLEAKNEQLRERNAELEDRLAAVEAELGIDATASQQGVADD